jgi:hypothetical protein
LFFKCNSYTKIKCITETFIQEKTKIIMRRIMKSKLRHLVGKLLFAIIVTGLGLASCTYHTNDWDPSVAPPNVSFGADIIPIFDASCNTAGCHNGSITPTLTEDVAYVSLMGGGYVVPEDSEGSILYQVIDGGTMQAFASDLELSYIKTWIDEGALDN